MGKLEAEVENTEGGGTWDGAPGPGAASLACPCLDCAAMGHGACAGMGCNWSRRKALAGACGPPARNGPPNPLLHPA